MYEITPKEKRNLIRKNRSTRRNGFIKSRGAILPCANCGKDHKVSSQKAAQMNKIGKLINIYCSTKCKLEHETGKKRFDKNLVAECCECNKKFTPHERTIASLNSGKASFDNIFCSKTCSSKNRFTSGKCIPRKKEIIKKNCKNCGKEFVLGHTQASHYRSGKYKEFYCSIKCSNKSRELFPHLPESEKAEAKKERRKETQREWNKKNIKKLRRNARKKYKAAMLDTEKREKRARKSRIYRSRRDYGEYGEAHRALIKLENQLKGKKDGTQC